MDNHTPPPRSPLVSVIIPMYNVEKYIELCLDSVLAQTFKDFELIVVNNGSTDNSPAILESYIPKFEGRLKIINIPVNTGGPSVPRNKGLEIAQGKYVYFMDSDDFVISKTLETFYSIAEETQSDVVLCTKYFLSNGEGNDFFQAMILLGDVDDFAVGAAPEDLTQKLKLWGNGYFPAGVWLHFVKRNFLIENDIKFLPVNTQQDSIWAFEVMCLAKKIIRVPYICYIYRFFNPGSIVSVAYDKTLTPKSIYKKFDRIIRGIKHVDNFMSKLDFFKNNPQERFAVIDFMIQQNLNWIRILHLDSSPLQIYENFKEAFKAETGDFEVLISYFVANSINLIKENLSMKEKIKQLEALNTKNNL